MVRAHPLNGRWAGRLPVAVLVVGLAWPGTALGAAEPVGGAMPAGPATTAGTMPTLLPGPVLPPGTVVIHGRWRDRMGAGETPFWLRLGPAEVRWGGHRRIELVREVPAPATGQPLLSDCPFLLVDGAGRLMAWDDRTTATRIDRTATGYDGTVELAGPDDQPRIDRSVHQAGPAAWERSVAPLLLALAWRAGTSARVPLVDPLGGGPATTAALAWDGVRVDLDGVARRVEADSSGRLQRLGGGDGADLVTVLARSELPP